MNSEEEAAALVLCSMKNSEEEEAAALVLCCMKNSKVDYQTALELQETRLPILKKHQFQHPLSPSPLSDNNTRLLSLVPPSLAQVIGNCSTPLDKRLTATDTKKNQVRLLFKYRHVMQFLNPLLRPSEVYKIKKTGMAVCVYDCFGRMYEMVFKLWASKAYVLTTPNWFQFCVDHGLKRDLDWVTIWMFRHNVTGRICFVITSEPRIVAKAIAPVFDLPVGARKKRTRSCRSSSSNSKRRRLNDDNGVIVTGRICFVITSEPRIVAKAIAPVFDLPLGARKKRTRSCSSSSNSKRRRLNDDDGLIVKVSPDQAQPRAMLVQILGAERCMEVGDYMFLLIPGLLLTGCLALYYQNLADLVARERDGRAIELQKETYMSFSQDMDDEYEKLIRRMNPPRVVIDNESCKNATVIQVDTATEHGILLEVVQVLTDLNLTIAKAYISSNGGWFMDVLNVTDQYGNEITDAEVLDYIYKAIRLDSNFGYSIRRSMGLSLQWSILLLS